MNKNITEITTIEPLNNDDKFVHEQTTMKIQIITESLIHDKFTTTTNTIPTTAVNSNISEITDQKQKPASNSFSHFHQHPPKIHEELIDDLTDEKFWISEKEKNLEQLIRDKSKPKIPSPFIGSNNMYQSQQRMKDVLLDKNLRPINKDIDPVGASGPFITLCEKLGIKSNQNNQNNFQHIPQTTAFTYNGPQFHIHHTSTGPMFLPNAAETMKGSAQITLNSGYNYIGTPVCFMAQYKPQLHTQQMWPAQPIQPYPGVGYVANNFGKYYSDVMNNNNIRLYGLVEPRSKDIVYVPINLYSKNYGTPMQPEQGDNLQQQSSPVFCTYLPTINQQFYGQRKDYMDGGSGERDNDEDESLNIPSDSDIIYASYPNQLMAFAKKSNHNYCKSGTISCFSTSQCILKSKWCDSKVDCLDASDESSCSCKSRLPKSKICDGYIDCPRGSDEMGCFGCDKFSYSCYYNKDEYINSKQSSISMCYSAIEKCDGFENCLNGKDEKECSMLVRSFGHHMSYMTSYSEGYLHRNYKGKWYPVCDNPMKWAKQACESEVNQLDGIPIIEYKQGVYPGQFIQPTLNVKTMINSDLLKPTFSDTCPINNKHNKNVIVYVKCPLTKCGHIKSDDYLMSILNIKKAESEKNPDKRSTDDLLRVVGGTPSNPMKWPFIVGLYRNGYFHCGGMIHNEYWIITAAHCVDKYHKYYYEIRAGMLRRYSYAPMSQIIKVKQIVVHEFYSRVDMKNDLALLKLDERILFNRWVKPICLPSPERTTNDNHWIWGPRPGTLCTAVGWGAIREKGPDPDHLREVSVPVLANCKHKEDREGAELCAGESTGGRDACQGDSGGPLFCKSVSDPNEWYLAGVISHGEGCARPDEPGVYTRISLYIDWIFESEATIVTRKIKLPLQDCPGYRCVWGGGLCIPKKRKCDGIVDCLGGEDEIECEFRNEESLLGMNATSVVSSSSTATESPHKTSEFSKTHHSTDKHFVEFTTAASSVITNLHDTNKQHSLKPIRPHHSTSENSHDKIKYTTSKYTTIHTSSIKPPKKHIASTQQPTHYDKIFHYHKTTDEPEKHYTTPNSHHYDISTAKPIQIHDNKWKNITNLHLLNKFICKDILQSIHIDHRCDGIIDCEDGTDEKGCTCKDYLNNKKKDLICDGKIDCDDLSDEKNCLNCKHDEYACQYSKKCIPLKLKCDDKDDCEFKEDELECFSLTDGHTVNLDVNLKPILNHKGFVCKNTNGIWRPICSNTIDILKNGAETAKNICQILGFGNFQYFNASVIPDNQMKVESLLNLYRNINYKSKRNKDDDSDNVDDDKSEEINENDNDYKYFDYEEVVVGDKKSCVAFYVECSTHSATNYSYNKDYMKPTNKPPIHNIQPIINPFDKPSVIVHYNQTNGHNSLSFHNDTEFIHSNDFHWSWSAGIYVQGKLICIGAILSENWVITESSCLNLVRLDIEHVAVVLGNSKAYLNVKGPYEKIVRVDCYTKLKTGNIILLHLEKSINYNRECLPSFIPESYEKNEETECLAISYDKKGRIINLPIILNKHNRCLSGHKCYESKYKKDFELLRCNGEGVTRIGVVMCRTTITNEWFPESFYSHKSSLCAFEHSFPVLTLDQFSKNIHDALKHDDCEKPYSQPLCHGFRCKLGQCLSEDKICDGKFHCHDGSDEKNCNKKTYKEKCRVSDIKCANGKCVPKTKFCNHINDCGDFSDEPNECSCYTYLRATDPLKICDGIRNCWDKTDENPTYCSCQSNSFKCKNSALCIPNDFICDKENDCPNGDDEQYCYGLEDSSFSDNDGYAQVIEQSYGIWHTKCFPRSNPPDQKEIEDICKQLGYLDTSKVNFRVIQSSTTARSGNDTIVEIGQYLQAPTKTIIYNKFSTLRINDQLTLYMKPSRPIAKLVKWDETDNENCYRMEIRCE